MDLTKWSEEINQGNKERGFWDEESPNIPEKLALIHSEVSEALEALRDGRILGDQEWDPACFKLKVKDTFEDEIADVIIRCLDLCGYLGVDIQRHVKTKLEYNSKRPHKHGKKF